MWNNISGGCSFTKVIYWICCNNSRWYRKSSMESWELLLKVPTSSFEDENLTQNFGHVKRIWGSWPTWHLFNKSEKKSLSTMFLNHRKKSPHCWKIKKGFQPHMNVEGVFYVNSYLEKLMFDELRNACRYVLFRIQYHT